ncbi:C4BPA protein, partial [Heliornis fulica]|nr:C4BPA protein [Heliornis fulica]
SIPLPAGDCWNPPRFDFAEAPTPLEDSYAVGVTLMYKCRPGYRMAPGKSPRVTCLLSSHWSSDPDFCIGKSCKPPEIPNGNFDYSNDLLFGATINFTCNVGYRLIGEQSAECILKDGEVVWSKVPQCVIIPCLPPPEIENGQFNNGFRDFIYGMSVTYHCNKGFSLIGEATIHCTTDSNLEGKWSGPAPECKVVRCENPEVENGRRLSGFGTKHVYQNSVTFECNPGYSLKGSTVVTCEADSTWKPPLPTCDAIYCGPAPVFPFAELTQAVGDSSPFGTKLRYHCKPGYVAADGKSSVVTCLSDSTWSADLDFCIGISIPLSTDHTSDLCTPDVMCSDAPADVHPTGRLPDIVCTRPPTIDNGLHNGTEGTNFAQGSVIVYKCKEGFTLAGTASIHCRADSEHHGVWSKPTPECRGGANMIIVGLFPLLLAMLVVN